MHLERGVKLGDICQPVSEDTKSKIIQEIFDIIESVRPEDRDSYFGKLDPYSGYNVICTGREFFEKKNN